MILKASTSHSKHPHRLTLERNPRALTPYQVMMVNLAPAELGEFGSLHLLVRNGKLRVTEVTVSVEVIS